jgi:uncharacterized protein
VVADLAPLSWGSLVLLAVAAALSGFSKTAVGGVGLISVATFAAVLPSRASTGVLLPLLIVGDLVAVRAYRAHADWATLVRLVPAVGVGVVIGVGFVSRVDDTVMRRAIGAVLILLLALQVAGRRQPGTVMPVTESGRPTRWWTRWGFGSMSGFTTMVANAGGPAMSLYLLSARFSVMGFLGTTSWFFFVINLLKVPFSVGLGLIGRTSLLLDLALAPAVLLGTWVGRRVIGRVRQDVFETLVLATTLLAGLNLLR